jgi:endonuclease/exonuclease/phosphatase (EEP) superfamily protein YafD
VTAISNEKTVSRPSRALRREKLAICCAAFSIALWLGTTVSFLGCWDEVVAITIFPYWSWAVLGGISAYSTIRLLHKRWTWLLPVVWVVSTLCFSENLRPMLRLATKAPAQSENHSRLLRVITMNCAGNAAAASEFGALKPDVVMLQEIPSTNHLTRLTREWFGDAGSFVAGLDCAILARGVLSITDRASPQHISALLQIQNGPALFVTSLRLVPPVGRIDLWNPAAWRISADNRRLRRRQLQTALLCGPTEIGRPEIIAGDFNTPVPDAIFKLMRQYQDAWLESGRGWGNTALNNLPIARPDQIWLKKLHAVSSCAVQTKNSDHRLVVADIELPR